MVEFQELVVWAITFIAPTVYVIATSVKDIAINWLKTKTSFGFLIPEDEVAKRLQTTLEFAVAYATTRVREQNLVVKFDNDFIAYAVEYVKDSVPGAIERFGYTDARLADMVKARIGK
jgi:hypothetical protein